MKKLFTLSIILLLLLSCGQGTSERCRGWEEMQMKCQISYAEAYKVYQIPDWVKQQCLRYYPSYGCYYDSNKRWYW
jgi:hypothetical protein